MSPFESDRAELMRHARERRETIRRAEHCALHAKLLVYELAAAPLTLEPARQTAIRTALKLILTDTLAIGVDLGIDTLTPSLVTTGDAKHVQTRIKPAP